MALETWYANPYVYYDFGLLVFHVPWWSQAGSLTGSHANRVRLQCIMGSQKEIASPISFAMTLSHFFLNLYLATTLVSLV